jgi:hypothetical protein
MSVIYSPRGRYYTEVKTFLIGLAGMAMRSLLLHHRKSVPLPFKPAPLPTRSRPSIPDIRGNSQSILAFCSFSPLLPLHPRHRCRCFETTFLTGFTGERVAGRKQGMNGRPEAGEFRRGAGRGASGLLSMVVNYWKKLGQISILAPFRWPFPP